ncbi:hypothetical protein [Blastococcus sp. VKM Ac-2987]|uniref:hypothetical protein n=1 Tax=Blastococcus sp. VKM Ac-2987 TaxID=3004141 RepID=UPI0022ABC469|nr:hypothetical protein [Blastococcus sp. VKM Ac-2987]MCZ2858946.1 hypothetical protein [Blastococcus sp. VKM Ac-2987]
MAPCPEGAVVATPWLLAPLARWLPAARLIAVRDATRDRTRTASAFAAVTVTVAAVTTMAIGSRSESTQDRRDHVAQAPMGAAVVTLFQTGEEGWVAVEGIVVDQLPGSPVGRIGSLASAEGEPRSLTSTGSRWPTPGLTWPRSRRSGPRPGRAGSSPWDRRR